jgi:hypothetical protein
VPTWPWQTSRSPGATPFEFEHAVNGEAVRQDANQTAPGRLREPQRIDVIVVLTGLLGMTVEAIEAEDLTRQRLTSCRVLV